MALSRPARHMIFSTLTTKRVRLTPHPFRYVCPYADEEVIHAHGPV